MNQSTVVASEPMAIQPAIARQNGRGVWLYNQPCTRMTLMLSVYHAWGNPTVMPRSTGLIALTVSVSVLLLCAQG